MMPLPYEPNGSEGPEPRAAKSGQIAAHPRLQQTFDFLDPVEAAIADTRERTQAAIERLRPPVKAHGGKYYLAREIVPILLTTRQKTTEYLEPCTFGASVFLAMPRVQREILGDINPNVTDLWTVLSDPQPCRHVIGAACDHSVYRRSVRGCQGRRRRNHRRPDYSLSCPLAVLSRGIGEVVRLVRPDARRATGGRKLLAHVSGAGTSPHCRASSGDRGDERPVLGNRMGQPPPDSTPHLCRSSVHAQHTHGKSGVWPIRNDAITALLASRRPAWRTPAPRPSAAIAAPSTTAGSTTGGDSISTCRITLAKPAKSNDEPNRSGSIGKVF